MRNGVLKTFTVCLLALLILSLAACGGGNSGDNNSNNSNNNGNNQQNQNELTAATWRDALSEEYGFTLDAPSGWTFSAGSKGSTFYVNFATDAADFDEAYAAFAQNIFDQTAAITDGNYEHALWPNVKTADYDEIPKMLGIVFPLWYFNTGAQAIQLTLSDSKTTKTAQISPLTVAGEPATKPDGPPPGTWDGAEAGESEAWPQDVIDVIFPDITIPAFSSSVSGFEWRFSYFGHDTVYINAVGATEAMRTAYASALAGGGWSYSSMRSKYYKSGITIEVYEINGDGVCQIVIANLNYYQTR